MSVELPLVAVTLMAGEERCCKSIYSKYGPTFRCISPLSRQMDSTALRAVIRMVPPGVSYTPLDFMPTKRLSTMSTLPMPLSPATFREQQQMKALFKQQYMSLRQPPNMQTSAVKGNLSAEWRLQELHSNPGYQCPQKAALHKAYSANAIVSRHIQSTAASEGCLQALALCLIAAAFKRAIPSSKWQI